jgi:hypothetical protein
MLQAVKALMASSELALAGALGAPEHNTSLFTTYCHSQHIVIH